MYYYILSTYYYFDILFYFICLFFSKEYLILVAQLEHQFRLVSILKFLEKKKEFPSCSIFIYLFMYATQLWGSEKAAWPSGLSMGLKFRRLCSEIPTSDEGWS